MRVLLSLLASYREQVAHLIAERDGLRERLNDAHADRDAWKTQAERLSQPKIVKRVDLWGWFKGR